MKNSVLKRMQFAMWVGFTTICACQFGLADGGLFEIGVGIEETGGADLVDFRRDVVPVLTKLGCNAGSCHGAAVGRGGFRLSLYGSRPADDFLAIVRETKGRRINRASVEDSLFLRKPGGDIGHGGEQLFELDDENGKVLVQWLEQGARIGNSPRLVDLEINLSSLRLAKPGPVEPFVFHARFDDGSRRDVSRLTVLNSSDDSAVSVKQSTNQVMVHRQGRHLLVARYMDVAKPIEIIVPFLPAAEKIVWNRGQNVIDDQVYQKLNALRLPAATKVDDRAFIRRLSLDLRGRLPKPDEVKSFVDNLKIDKRQLLIQRFLNGEDFNSFWTCFFAKLLRVRSQPRDNIGAQVYHRWLRDQLADRRSWKSIATELLSAHGDSHEEGPANFFRATADARHQAEFVSESLMGVTLGCANCHNHPLDRWTQDDYHGLAAIFAKTKQGRYVVDNAMGENVHPATGRPATPRIPGDSFLDPDTDLRHGFQDWLLADRNKYFSNAIVNRIWKSLMGRGLVEPANDLRPSNPATHPELLNKLSEDFVAHDFDIRHTISLICNSHAYQRAQGSNQANPSLLRFYGVAARKSLSAEVLADAIGDVTGVPELFSGQPEGTRAIELFDSRIPSETLDILGRCPRDGSCESSEGRTADGLAARLHLLNGSLINEKLVSSVGRLQQMIAEEQPTGEIIERFYQLAYGRSANKSEARFWADKIPDTERQPCLEDLVWSLLNSQEFLTNH